MENMSQLRRNDYTPTRQSQDHISLDTVFLKVLPKPLARIFARCELHVYWINPFVEEINRLKTRILACYKSSHLFTHDDALEIVRSKQFKHDDGQLVVHAQGKGG